jgi:peptide/nickel transport system substrate-binding protein
MDLRRRTMVASLLATGALSVPISSGRAATRGGTMIYARRADSLFLDPVLNDANVDIWILTNIYDTLIIPTNDGKGLTPGLATSWVMSPDGKTFTLRLRPGVKFSDGTPLSINDVVWSLQRAANPQAGIWNFLLSSIADVSARGSDTVVLALKHPDPSLPAALATFNASILPKAKFDTSPGTTDQDKATAFAEHPIGTGPFMLSDWSRGSSMTLKRNPHYWQKDESGKQLPYLDAVQFQIIPDDATRILKLRAGEVDGAEFIPYARVKELQADQKIDMQLFPSTAVTYITANDRATLPDGSKNLLNDVRVRQALNYAISKPAMIQIVTDGIGTPMRSYMARTTPLFADGGDLYPYNLEKAKSLLKEAGYADGFPLTIMTIAGSADSVGIASAAQQMWSQIGVRLKIEQMDNATLVAHYRKGDFQLRTGAWTNDINDPNEITSYFTYYPNIQNQHSGWDSRETDALFAQSQSEMDQAIRAKEYAEIQANYVAAAPIIFLYESPYPVALRKGVVEGFWQTPLGNNIFVRASVKK